MRTFVLSLAALAALGFMVPYAAPAKAETVVVHRDHNRDMHPRHHHKVVIIKHGHDHS